MGDAWLLVAGETGKLSGGVVMSFVAMIEGWLRTKTSD
jgi:hypothetical protein